MPGTAGLDYFQSLKVPIVRYWRSPYGPVTANAGRVDKRFKLLPLANGDVRITIKTMLGQTVASDDEQFSITPESLKEIRLVFQIVPKEAYLFAFGDNGEIVIPKAFWQPFSQKSKKWVGVSRVFKISPSGRFHIRDIASKHVADILNDFRR